ncbi:MAG: hypothetical protein WCJ64_11795 [Rhodospirillaceae bacterium]
MSKLPLADRKPATTPAQAIAQRCEGRILLAQAELLSRNEPYATIREVDARIFEELGSTALALPNPPPVACGGEFVPEDYEYKDTVAAPDLTTAVASKNRVELAAEANALELAIDAAETVGANNSLEKMLAYQVVACHSSAMKLIGKAEKELARSDKLTEYYRHNSVLTATRLFGVATRLMSTCHGAAETIQKLRTGGKQTVNVIHQHVQVAGGGQAVVPGAMNRGEGGMIGGDHGK